MEPGYHIFFSVEDALHMMDKYQLDGYTWIYDDNYYIPPLKDQDMPIILLADTAKTLLFSIISYNKERYFSDPEFMKIYKKSYNIFYRDIKLKRVLGDD